MGSASSSCTSSIARAGCAPRWRRSCAASRPTWCSSATATCRTTSASAASGTSIRRAPGRGASTIRSPSGCSKSAAADGARGTFRWMRAPRRRCARTTTSSVIDERELKSDDLDVAARSRRAHRRAAVEEFRSDEEGLVELDLHPQPAGGGQAHAGLAGDAEIRHQADADSGTRVRHHPAARDQMVLQEGGDLDGFLHQSVDGGAVERAGEEDLQRGPEAVPELALEIVAETVVAADEELSAS